MIKARTMPALGITLATLFLSLHSSPDVAAADSGSSSGGNSPYARIVGDCLYDEIEVALPEGVYVVPDSGEQCLWVDPPVDPPGGGLIGAGQSGAGQSGAGSLRW